METYYKVVKKIEDRFFSLYNKADSYAESYGYGCFEFKEVEDLLKKGCILEYKLGEKTTPRPNCGGIAVFKTLQEARDFNSPWCSCIIKGIGKKGRHKTLRVGRTIMKGLRELPEGTVIVSEFTPEEIL